MLDIILAIDIIEGQAVRLHKGDYTRKTVYDKNPVEVAKRFEDAGIKRLHLVDLEGAKAKRVINLKVLENIASKTNLKIDFGGGIKSNEDIEQVYCAGAYFANVGSVAVTEPDLFQHWLNKYGAERIILGADVAAGMKIAIKGWTNVTEINLDDFIIEYQKKDIKYIICTDITRDGTLEGASVNLYKHLISKFPELKFISSGGVSGISDIEILSKIGVSGIIIGKAYYEGIVTLKELKKYV
ncbi:MAG: 1-(5-phosphoribosyl)-5-[(5-phosphoribosylamino)methylideneamino]imidazole-4-carboxamide isomerase [Bacteroidales bacterium]|nr:1-(5-phosphoribosyl)-5-[(5-phosphoribosylamino)methylideneamino]imidazole-4-carboxamide isomerase [Bacteroidales bacterium]